VIVQQVALGAQDNMAKRAGHRLPVFLHSRFMPYAKQLWSHKTTFEYELKTELPFCSYAENVSSCL
jgi:hypothetical protein